MLGFFHQHHHHSEKAFCIITEVHGLKGPQISSSLAPLKYLFLLVFGLEMESKVLKFTSRFLTQFVFPTCHSFPGNSLYP